MKQVSLFLASLFIVSLIYSQENMIAVTISVNSNRSPQVNIDGKDYSTSGSSIIDNKTTLTINDLQAGQHTFQVIRTNPNASRSDRISTIFNLRYGYDMLVKVNRNGSLELIETRKSRYTNYRSPMSDADFNVLMKNVRAQRSIDGRRSTIESAFSRSNNYFTTSQVIQLLQLVNSENYRLQLAKSSFRNVTDRNNFNQIDDLLNNQASINELDDYVNNYNEDDDLNNNNGSGNVNMAMSDANFNILYQSVKQQWPSSAQMTSLNNAFKNSNNYFTTAQAKQLIQLAGTENNRLQLAKLSYSRITDPANFNQIYSLFTSQYSRDELTAYVNNSNPGSNINVAMSDANFNTIYQAVQLQFLPGEKMSSLTNVFNNPANYFTTAQAKLLIQLVSLESNRLQLAKSSYRRIVDRNNFSQLYDMFNTMASRNELDAYVRSYKD